MAIHKLGAHIIGGTRLALGRPAVIKLVNVSPAYVAQVRAEVGPDCLVVVRFQFDEPKPGQEPRQTARDWYARRRGDMLAMKAAGPNIAFETAVNECTEEHLNWYITLSLELIPLMHREGLRCMAGNPSVGRWHETSWPRFRPVLDILTPGDFLGLHEYWSDTADIGNPWHCTRWTIPEIAAVIRDTPIVVTECGRDVTPDTGRGKRGWRKTCNAETFLADLRQYDGLLCRFPQVRGATVFQTGNDPEWADFEVVALWGRVVAETEAWQVPQPQPPAPPAPPVPLPPAFDWEGRRFDPADFALYVAALDLRWARRLVIHHTYKPTVERWLEYGGAYWMQQALPRTYRGKGWSAGPHVYAAPDGIWVGTPPSRPGVGVVGYNEDSLHLEIVGDYSRAVPSGPTLAHAMVAVASLSGGASLGPENLWMHRELQAGQTCPGDELARVFSRWFRQGRSV